MRSMLLGLAPLAALGHFAFPAAPAQAQWAANPGFGAAPGASVQSHVDDDDDDDDDGRHDGRHRHPHFPPTVVIGDFGPSPGWALYNNRSWAPDSFNDWWHERPWRAYPRWMQGNQNCDRLWWGGGAWRCSW